MKILLPISLDRWRNPIATLLRTCVEWNPDIEFHSFSKPTSNEDVTLGSEFWKRPNVRLIKPHNALIERYDIAHIASLTQRNLTAGLLAKIRSMGKTRFLATINLEIIREDSRTWKSYRRALHVVDRFAAVSDTVKKSIIADVGERFTQVIPNGFDQRYFDPALCEDAELPAKIDGQRPIILYVSALEARKNPDFFIELAQRLPEFEFVAVGYVVPGVGEPFLERMEAAKHVTWLGHVDRRVIRNLMAKATALVFPSEREGLPLSVIEALGMGLPVMAQPRSSLPELISDGKNGYLMEIDQIDIWCEKLRSLKDVNTRGLLSSPEIRANTIKSYSFENIGRHYGDLYRKLLHERQP